MIRFLQNCKLLLPFLLQVFLLRLQSITRHARAVQRLFSLQNNVKFTHSPSTHANQLINPQSSQNTKLAGGPKK